ncbi:hypothetical protein D3C74_349770 [compost metagenome]
MGQRAGVQAQVAPELREIRIGAAHARDDRDASRRDGRTGRGECSQGAQRVPDERVERAVDALQGLGRRDPVADVGRTARRRAVRRGVERHDVEALGDELANQGRELGRAPAPPVDQQHRAPAGPPLVARERPAADDERCSPRGVVRGRVGIAHGDAGSGDEEGSQREAAGEPRGDGGDGAQAAADRAVQDGHVSSR